MAESAAPARAASENGISDVNTDRALSTASFVRTWTDDLLDTASRFRRELYRLDGHVVAERLDYEDRLRVREAKLPRRAPRHERRQAVFEVALPIERLPELLDWLRIESVIVEQYVIASRDMSLPAPAVVAEQTRQTEQLAQRLAELEQRIAQAAQSGEDVAALEAERGALAAALAQMSAQAAAMPRAPAVRLATLEVRFEAGQPQVRFAAARIVPSVRASVFVTDLLDQDDSREARVGVAVGVGLPSAGRGGLVPSPLLELAGYPSTADRGAGVSVTVGGGIYARSLGEGERLWLNPFAGLRMGYAHWDAHAFVIAGELGVDLMKTGGVAWSASVRPQGLIGSDSQVGLEAGTSLSLAF